MREITIEITQYCPWDCEYCSSMASLEGKHLLFASIRNFLLSHEKIDRINISGGEPLSHPEFYKILQLCKSLTRDVWVYTNELTQIRYNTDVIEEVTVDANVCLMPGKVSYIPQNAHEVHLLQFVPQGRGGDMLPANLKISGQVCGKCNECDHVVLQADGRVVGGPCRKEYKE